ncbi:MAG: hypothetical protein RL065_2235 [Bacteroidota bacterium]|jgi:hypothetical protein
MLFKTILLLFYRFNKVNFSKNILIILSLLLSYSAQAQYHEVGVQGGVASYIGDLNNQIFAPKFGAVGGAFYRKNFTPHFAWRTNLNVGRFSFDSKWSKSEYIQYQNLNFRNTITEAVTMIEFNFFKYKANRDSKALWSPYIFWGGGFAYYYLDAKYDNKHVYLPGKRTEGKDYVPFIFTMPFGGGLKFNVAKSITFSMECMYHHTYTDYLDDVNSTYIQKKITNGKNPTNIADPSNTNNILSDVKNKQRGDQFKDKYFFVMLSLSYTFFTPHCPNPDSEDSFDK